MTAEEIAVRLENHEQEIKSLKHRMTSCEEQQNILNKLVNSVDRLALKMEYMTNEQKEQGERLARLEQEPVNSYKHYKQIIIGCILTGVCSAILGAVLSIVFKGGF